MKRKTDTTPLIFNTPEFKALNEKWRGKLKSSGFKDCEDEMQRLLEWHNNKWSSKNPLAYATQSRYYELASQLLHTYPFECSLDKAIWQSHCGGLSAESIGVKLGITRYRADRIVGEISKRIKV